MCIQRDGYLLDLSEEELFDLDGDIRFFHETEIIYNKYFFSHFKEQKEVITYTGVHPNSLWHQGLLKYGLLWTKREYELREEK